MRKIKEIIMERDGLSADEAEELIQEARNEFYSLLESGDIVGAENIMYDWFGLEPDYLEEFFL